MPPDDNTGASRSLTVIVYSDAFDKVHYALAAASAAAAVGRPATLFFTMGAIQALFSKNSTGTAGWPSMQASDGRAASALDADYAARGIADFETLLDACKNLGVRFMICEMGLKAIAAARDSLRDDLTLEAGGLATVMMESADGSLLFV